MLNYQILFDHSKLGFFFNFNGFIPTYLSLKGQDPFKWRYEYITIILRIEEFK